MAIPAEYFYKRGFYWKKDGTGPYKWDGALMSLVETYTIAASSTASLVDRNLFNRDESGPAVKT